MAAAVKKGVDVAVMGTVVDRCGGLDAGGTEAAAHTVEGH